MFHSSRSGFLRCKFSLYFLSRLYFFQSDNVAKKNIKQPWQSNNLMLIECWLCYFRSFDLLSFVSKSTATLLYHNEDTVILYSCNKLLFLLLTNLYSIFPTCQLVAIIFFTFTTFSTKPIQRTPIQLINK